MSARPRPLLIGLSPRLLAAVPPQLGFRGKTLQYLEQSVAHWVMALGALPVMVPTVQHDSPIRRSDVHVHDFVAALDGLILQGGADIHPRLYGQEASPHLGAVDELRDRFELDLLRGFAAAGKPVFGICRGLQLINVACGGTLYQDLRAEGASTQAHSHADAYDRHDHGLHIAAGSWLSSRYGGATTGRVNSIHHQGIARLGAGLVVEAQAEDGVIECVRGSGPHFLLGVQWHPEFHDGSDPDLLPADPLLQAFLDAAAQRRG